MDLIITGQPSDDPADLEIVAPEEMSPLDKMRDPAYREKFMKEHPNLFKDTNGLGTAGNAAATFLKGVPFAGEYMDELLGKIAPYVGPNSEETATQAIRGGQDKMERENPKTALGLKVAGGVAGSLPVAAMAPWYAPSTMAGKIAYGAAGGAGVGGLEGAVSGYGSGTDDESRMNQAKVRGLLGTALGGAIGAGAPLVSEGIKHGSRWIMDQFNVARQAKQAGLSTPSHEILARAMDADGSLQGRGAQNIAAAGPDAMPVDAGPNAVALLDATIQRSGKAGNVARDAIEQRATNANKTVTQALDGTLGPYQGLMSSEAALRQGTSSARSNAYGAAYNAPIDYADPSGQAIESLLSRVPGEAISSANKLMQVGGDKSKQIMAQIAPDGSVTYKVMPDVRQLDYITRALNQAAKSGDGMGALGGQTDIGRQYQNLSREIRQAMRAAVPEYGVALDTAAEPIAAREALRLGEGLLSRSTTRDEVATSLKGMSQAELQNARTGVRSYIDEKLANVTRALTDNNMDAREAITAVKELSSRANREKITALVGQREADQMFTAIDRAAKALDLRAGVAQNSKTFARTEIDRTVKDYTDDGLMRSIQSGEPVSAVKRLVQKMLGGTSAAKQAKQDKVYEEIATFLTGSRGADAQKAYQLLQGIATKSPQNAKIAAMMARALTAGGASAAYQTGTQLLADMARRQGQQ